MLSLIDISLFKINTQYLWGRFLDRPKNRNQIDIQNNEIEILGWVLGKSSTAVAVEIISEGKIIQKVPINRKRPGVAKAYPQVPEAKNSGFVTKVKLPELVSEQELTLKVILKDETAIPIGKIKITPLPSPPILEVDWGISHQTQEQPTEATQEPRVEILDVHLLELDSKHLSGNYIDTPQKGDRINTCKVKIGGWVVGKSSPAIAVEVSSNGKVLQVTPIDQSFPHVSRHHAHIFWSKIVGFSTKLDLRGLSEEVELVIKAILEDKEERIPIAKLRLRHNYTQTETLEVNQKFQQLKKEHNIAVENLLAENRQFSSILELAEQAPYKWLVTSEVEKSSIVAGICMVKDEDDMIYYSLAGNYRQGIRRFVVIDNLSTDATPYEVRRFRNDYPEALVYLLEDADPVFEKYKKISAAAEFAHKLWNAKWILPFDTDEVLFSYNQSLHTILQQLDSKHQCIGLARRNHVIMSFDDEFELNPLKRMTYRKKQDNCENDGYSKIFVRWKPGMTIGQGHHRVSFKDKTIPVTVLGKDYGLVLREYQFRSKEQTRKKIVNGGKAYKNITKVQGGRHWQNRYQVYQELGEKFIDEFYDSLVDEEIDVVYDPAWL
ncbi:MAG: hypothetical protein F6K22_18100 [Okeania sp. SIO2F4]|uniref:glycosyltransferase family 2 protein n=1 Tax=Okeania sp. SIO2F4 TaxID=2607790 RepID=UPI00142BD4FF|nr:glycosyltransferase family 2 protein [Okeania sp. SIO2F4]NES04572.1 hypothetical protein [Okeania sp. SIO2F4]